MLEDIITTIVDTVSQFGYLGIFFMMFLESTVFPLPSELVLIPAGYLAYRGEMNPVLVILCGIAGSLAGALFNYYLSLWLGRKFLRRYGKYFFVTHNTLDKIDSFFEKHGHISTFTGRLIPGVRHFISIPAGLAKMDLALFSFYTTAGSTIWVVILTLLGYFIGHNEDLIKVYMNQIIVLLMASLTILIIGYIWWHRRKTQQNDIKP